MMNKHNAIIREIAEEMAKSTSREEWSMVADWAKESRILNRVEYARIAVKRMEKVARVFLERYTEFPDIEIDAELIERGLIPDPAQEGKANEM